MCKPFSDMSALTPPPSMPTLTTMPSSVDSIKCTCSVCGQPFPVALVVLFARLIRWGQRCSPVDLVELDLLESIWAMIYLKLGDNFERVVGVSEKQVSAQIAERRAQLSGGSIR